MMIFIFKASFMFKGNQNHINPIQHGVSELLPFRVELDLLVINVIKYTGW